MATSQQSFGIKIAQPGYDVNTAPDYALSFNSSWPQLPILKQYTVTVTPILTGGFWSYDTQVFTHNLGFFAWSMVWETDAASNVGSIRTKRANKNLTISDNSVTWNPAIYNLVTVQPLPITVHVKVYNIDISKHVKYDYLQPPVVQTSYDPNFGLKVVKEGKSIDSKDMRDFIIHSRAQSPAILAILTEIDAVSNIVSYTNPQGYTNWVYGYVKFGNNYLYTEAQGQSYPVYQFVDGKTYSISTQGTNKVSLVILRDPLFVAAKVDVTY